MNNIIKYTFYASGFLLVGYIIYKFVNKDNSTENTPKRDDGIGDGIPKDKDENPIPIGTSEPIAVKVKYIGQDKVLPFSRRILKNGDFIEGYFNQSTYSFSYKDCNNIGCFNQSLYSKEFEIISRK